MKAISHINKKLALILLLQVILCLGVWWPKDSKTMTHPNPLAAVEFSSMSHLEISQGGETPKHLTLEKKGGIWVVPDQQNFPADEGMIDSAFSKLKSLALGGPVARQSSSHKKLQVSEADFQRKVAFDGGDNSKAVGFYLGSSPQFKQVYLRAMGEDEVFTSDKVSAFDFSVESKDWVQKSLINISSEMLQSIEIKREHETLKISRSEKKGDETPGSWLLNGKEVKPGALDPILRNLSDLQLTQVVGQQEKPEYGLNRPKAVVGVKFLDKDQKLQEKTFTIAKLKSGDFIARVTGMEYLVGLAPYQVNPMIESKVKDLIK